MKSLLENKFAPLTFAWGFLESSLQTVGETFIEWRRSHLSKIKVTSINELLATALLKLQPLITPPRKELLLETRSGWTAYFDNGINGGDPASPMGYLAQRLKCRGLAITCVPHTLKDERTDTKGTYGAVQFELFAPEPREWLNYERAIGASNDGGKWVFINEGALLPFEMPERYKAKRIRDRFTDEMLEDYCRALGIELFHADFYGPKGLLVEIGDRLPPEHVPLTLAEARQSIGFEP